MTTKRKSNKFSALFSGLWPIFKKEVIHITQDTSAIGVVLFISMVELILIGYSVNFNVRQINTVVYDLSNTQQSRALMERFASTDYFRIVRNVHSDQELNDALMSGETKVGIKIPVDYARLLLEGRTADILVLIDGTNEIFTAPARDVSNAVALLESIDRINGQNATPNLVEARPVVLFNPDSNTATFVLPGMLAIVLQGTLVIMVSSTIVRENERGTLEQLSMTPVGPFGLIVGKMLPYVVIGLVQQVELIILMRFIFHMPFNGSYLLLLLCTVPFLLIVLGLGLLISATANTQAEAQQMSIGLFIISFYLSGYFFPVENMPPIMQWVTKFVPAYYFVDVVRSIIVRGAGFKYIWLNAVIMLGMGIVVISVAANEFRKKIA